MSAAKASNILGISAYYHDSAAALLKDGELVAAVQQERFSRKKHDARFPDLAIRYCLELFPKWKSQNFKLCRIAQNGGSDCRTLLFSQQKHQKSQTN